MGGCRQEGVVLPSTPPRLPSNRTAAAAHRASSAAYRAGRSLQLRRWFRELDGGLVRGQEGVVLQSPRQGLSESRRWLCDVLQAIRLQCWFRKLDGGLVRGEEGLVLQQRRQRLPTSSWWVCLKVFLKCPGNDSAARSSHRFSLIVAALAFVPSSGAQRQLPEGSERRGECRLERWHSCHLPVLDLVSLTDVTG